MPSKSFFWFTHHDSNISLLHVSSNDPRRCGEQHLAMFDSNLYAGLVGYEWKVKSGRIENEHRTSFLAMISNLCKRGSIQIEPNCDFRSTNFKKRECKVDASAYLEKYRSDPNWLTKRYHKKYNSEVFPKQKAKVADDWCILRIEVDDGAAVDIKVNKRHAHFIPKRMVYRPQRVNQLYLLPNEVQRARPKHINDHRHGRTLSDYLSDTVSANGMLASNARNTRSDPLDYRINLSNGRYVCAVYAKNIYHKVADGYVLEVFYPEGAAKEWSEPTENVYPQCAYLNKGAERHCYFLIDDDMIDRAREQDWITFRSGIEAYASQFQKDDGTLGNTYALKKLVVVKNNVNVAHHVEKPRLTRGYLKAIDAGEKGYASRSKYENTIMSDQNTSNRMFTKAKERMYRRLHCDKYVAIPELNVIALDVRFQSIRLGGQKESIE